MGGLVPGWESEWSCSSFDVFATRTPPGSAEDSLIEAKQLHAGSQSGTLFVLVISSLLPCVLARWRQCSKLFLIFETEKW